jgi:hypothetical protein
MAIMESRFATVARLHVPDFVYRRRGRVFVLKSSSSRALILYLHFCAAGARPRPLRAGTGAASGGQLLSRDEARRIAVNVGGL